MIYFDHNATTPLHPAARAAWLEVQDRFPANPSSPHRLASRAEHALEEARAQLAQILGCEPSCVVLTSGATESANLVLHHFSRVLEKDRNILVSTIEHPAILSPAAHYFGSQLRLAPTTSGGMIDVDWFEAAFQDQRPALVALMAANNETGVLQPWRRILETCQNVGVPLIVDVTQWVGKLPSGDLGKADYVIGSAHKFGGPKGVGFLKCPSAVSSLQPLLLGGPQENGRRGGTENVAGVVSMVAALRQHTSTLADPNVLTEKIATRSKFCTELVQALPGATILGGSNPVLWNTVSVLMPEVPCQARWVVKLDRAGFAVSTGSACSSGQEKPSSVLTAMGLGAQSSRILRFSSGWETPASDWDLLLAALKQVYQDLSQS